MSINHRARRTWMRVCLVPSAIFCKLKNGGSWGGMCLHQILFQIGKNFYGDFSDVAADSWKGLFEPYAMSWVVPAFQIGQNVHRRQPQIWTSFHVNGWWSCWESACCDSSKSSPNCPWSCRRSSCHLVLTDKLKMWCVAAKFVPHVLTDAQKENRVTVSQELIDRSNADENFLKNVKTGDETWVYGYSVETKVHSSHWMGKLWPRPKEAHQIALMWRWCW